MKERKEDKARLKMRGTERKEMERNEREGEGRVKDR